LRNPILLGKPVQLGHEYPSGTAKGHPGLIRLAGPEDSQLVPHQIDAQQFAVFERFEVESAGLTATRRSLFGKEFHGDLSRERVPEGFATDAVLLVGQTAATLFAADPARLSSVCVVKAPV
jgi:hypothetical protein